jgi:MFS family permease
MIEPLRALPIPSGLPSAFFCASFKSVDHSCEKCGARVEDGRPFCPQCRAPQIHVEVAVPVAEDASDSAAGNPLAGVQEIPRFDRALTPHQSPFDRGAATRAALKAGVLGFFVGMIPVLGIVLTGSLAVYFYRREKGLAPAAGIGSRLGGAAGVVSFAINSLLIVVRLFALHAQQEYTEALLKIAQAVGYNPADPEIQSAIRNLFTPSGLALTLFFGMLFAVALAALGGALAALVLRHPPRG